jgi:hypothetical protein
MARTWVEHYRNIVASEPQVTAELANRVMQDARTPSSPMGPKSEMAFHGALQALIEATGRKEELTIVNLLNQSDAMILQMLGLEEL